MPQRLPVPTETVLNHPVSQGTDGTLALVPPE